MILEKIYELGLKKIEDRGRIDIIFSSVNKSHEGKRAFTSIQEFKYIWQNIFNWSELVDFRLKLDLVRVKSGSSQLKSCFFL
jgi:hypothetical protein